MKEIWKDIKGFEGQYQVSNLGRVRSLLDKNRNLRSEPLYKKTHLNINGYERITLCKENISKKFSIHRLVAQEFIDNPNNKPQVNHIDGNKLNNKVNNLEWITQSENNKHAFKNKLMSTNFKIKLTEKEVLKIREMYSGGDYSYNDLSIIFNVCKSQIGNIVNYKLWKHI